jgi:hypothetical protein
MPASCIPLTTGGDTQFVGFDVPDFSVTAGDVLAIVLRTPAGATLGATDSSPFGWACNSDNAYARGRTFARGVNAGALTWGDGDTFSLANTDYQFRTYVMAVPEPTPLGLLSSGFVVLIGAVILRHRRLRLTTSMGCRTRGSMDAALRRRSSISARSPRLLPRG